MPGSGLRWAVGKHMRWLTPQPGSAQGSDTPPGLSVERNPDEEERVPGCPVGG